MKKIDVRNIIIDESKNVRGKVDKDSDSYKDLVSSIKEYGVMQPVGLYSTDGKYGIVWGFRRVMAAVDAGLKKIPCIVIKGDRKDYIVAGIVENLHREDMTPIKEAEVIEDLMSNYGMKIRRVAKVLSKSRGWVDQRISLLHANDEVKKMVNSGEICFSSAVEISTLSEKDQNKAVERIKNISEDGEKVPHYKVKREKRQILRKRRGISTIAVDEDRVKEIRAERKKKAIDGFFKERGVAYSDAVYITKKTIDDFCDFLEEKKILRWF